MNGVDPAAVLAAIDPGLTDRPLRPLGEGWDNVVHAVGDDLVLRIVKDPSPRDLATHVAREVALLAVAERACPVAVGAVVDTAPELGALLCRRVPGVAFDDLPEADQQRVAVPVAREVSTAIAPVHGVALSELPDLVEPLEPLAVHRDELAEEVDAVRATMPADLLVVAEAHLAGPVPPDAPPSVFCHNDLGGEHVMVDPTRGHLTGLIDWSDAMRADPIRDLALLLADCGEDAFAAAVAVHPSSFGAADLARARWCATHALVGTLAYHLARADPAAAQRTASRLRRLTGSDAPRSR